MFLSLSLAPFHPLCSKLSLNEFQIMLKCSERHFQLFYTVILPAKLLSTHAHTQMQTVWRSIKSLWHLHCCTIMMLQWIISQSFPCTGQSQGDGKRQHESEMDTYSLHFVFLLGSYNGPLLRLESFSSLVSHSQNTPTAKWHQSWRMLKEPFERYKKTKTDQIKSSHNKK